MPKTKESIRSYNKEYFARPAVVERAKVRNAKRRGVRKLYKQTEAGKAAQRRYLATDKYRNAVTKSRLKALYGITPEERDAMFKAQNESCAICGKSDGVNFHIDHDHINNKVRGILCGQCNMALGLIKDNVDTLKGMIAYLR